MILKRLLTMMLAASFGILPTNAAETSPISSTSTPCGVTRIEAPGLHNLFALGLKILSGSSPDGEKGFKALTELGVKTIISVDGARPDVGMARRFGMRYIHIPHGYDGIGTNAQLELVKAARTASGLILVHCHHGLHRGPAAAAVICMANEGWTPSQGEAWLKTAGTGTNYVGLYQTVREFRAPTNEQLDAVPSEFPETANVSGLIDAMVEIDACWDHLKAVRESGYRTSEEHPDVHPPHEAVILREHYREAQRLPESVERGDAFLALLKSAELEAIEAERWLSEFSGDPNSAARARLDKTFDALGRRCASCHQVHREPDGISR